MRSAGGARSGARPERRLPPFPSSPSDLGLIPLGGRRQQTPQKRGRGRLMTTKDERGARRKRDQRKTKGAQGDQAVFATLLRNFSEREGKQAGGGEKKNRNYVLWPDGPKYLPTFLLFFDFFYCVFGFFSA